MPGTHIEFGFGRKRYTVLCVQINLQVFYGADLKADCNEEVNGKEIS